MEKRNFFVGILNPHTDDRTLIKTLLEKEEYRKLLPPGELVFLEKEEEILSNNLLDLCFISLEEEPFNFENSSAWLVKQNNPNVKNILLNGFIASHRNELFLKEGSDYDGAMKIPFEREELKENLIRLFPKEISQEV